MALFITGGTGFVGTEVISHLLRSSDEIIYVLVRSQDEAEAIHRLKVLWHDLPELTDQIGRRLIPLAGDFLQKDLGLSQDHLQSLRGNIHRIFHIGAQTGIQKSRQELMEVNRDGTARMLEFAHAIHQEGSLERFLYVSTAYTAGTRSGRILETDPLGEDFETYYEESKAAGEKLVRESLLPYTIVRPSMIVGNSKTGRIRSFNTIYYVLKLILTEKLRFLPTSPRQTLSLVPVDYVAESIVKLSSHPEAKNACFHLTPPQEELPTAGELCDYVWKWAEENLQLRLPRPFFLPLSPLKSIGLKHNRRTGEKKKSLLSNLTALLVYFYDDHIFDRSETDRLLGPYQLNWRDYMDPLLRFACRRNFLHLTDRNVFDQVLFRLKSKSAPITFYDVGEDSLKETTGEEMRQKIQKVALALWKLGVRKGDRVALTGINSCEYFSLDLAIGLCGGVTVPIYYTTPLQEIDLLLEKSGAKWFFVGDQRIMRQLGGLKRNLPVIAFSDGLKAPQKGKAFLTWDEFLQRGSNEPQNPPPVYIDPEDLATIRYTSGTTGEPKGVMFNAGQLAWMGQVLTALLPWREKQREMRYLSFLPLSHVVEGILASYAPYYVHCPVKYYYLNAFGQLTAALPRVRPTVFFSVPRFYEKLWAQIEENPLGQKYIHAKAGPLKNLLGWILKKGALKKAGLDQCSQLIVGSAPISEELLRRLRELGIEVHNAYGQTEAPLITINRLGRNVLPSIGTPLPDTKVTLAEDGELIVEGPQVCLGYYGLATDTIQKGVLKTGNLGSVDDQGYLYLIGRKKEMIVTSYGKNINCPKIEEKLRDLPGISQALLIGENRPYCTALLWAGETAELSHLPQQIEAMNATLSHPETIRRWTIVERPLTIKDGELTPNLKVKRAVVESHFHDLIEGMYEDKSPSQERPRHGLS